MWVGILMLCGFVVAILGTSITPKRFGKESDNVVDFLKINPFITVGIMLMILAAIVWIF